MPSSQSAFQVNLTLVPKFLQTSFPQVRQTLVGVAVPAQATMPDQIKIGVTVTAPRFAKLKLTPRVKKYVLWGLNGLAGISLLVAVMVFAPQIYYRLFPADTERISSLTPASPLGGEFDQGAAALPTRQRPNVPVDPSLPEGSWLTIPRIGVKTQPQAIDDLDTALYTGVWMVPEYGRPGDVDQPVIVAAHRFGWQWWWKDDYWKYHSFHNLPELEPGDMVEMIDGQRKYYYEVYAGEEGEEITDYSADLILYTCKFLNSPIRHFRYARLVDMNADTQATPGAG